MSRLVGLDGKPLTPALDPSAPYRLFAETMAKTAHEFDAIIATERAEAGEGDMVTPSLIMMEACAALIHNGLTGCGLDYNANPLPIVGEVRA